MGIIYLIFYYFFTLSFYLRFIFLFHFYFSALALNVTIGWYKTDFSQLFALFTYYVTRVICCSELWLRPFWFFLFPRDLLFSFALEKGLPLESWNERWVFEVKKKNIFLAICCFSVVGRSNPTAFRAITRSPSRLWIGIIIALLKSRTPKANSEFEKQRKIYTYAKYLFCTECR